MKRVGSLKKIFRKHKFVNETQAQPGVHQMAIVLDGLKPDFNVGKIFRTADAFGVREIHLINIPFFNPVTARGSFKHVPAKFYSNFSSSYGRLSEEGYVFYTFDPKSEVSLSEVKLPEKSAFVFGHEEFGLSFSPADYKDVVGVKIPQFGKVQSLNVSVAASIAMYEYMRQR